MGQTKKIPAEAVDLGLDLLDGEIGRELVLVFV
jgi:hypothetical protein